MRTMIVVLVVIILALAGALWYQWSRASSAYAQLRDTEQSLAYARSEIESAIAIIERQNAAINELLEQAGDAENRRDLAEQEALRIRRETLLAADDLEPAPAGCDAGRTWAISQAHALAERW